MRFDIHQHLKNSGRSVRLYVYGRDGYHSGGQWVATVLPRKFPGEEIYLSEAVERIKEAEENGLEVRVTDVLDMMVYHSIGSIQLVPEVAA